MFYNELTFLTAKKSSQDVVAWVIGMVFIILIIGMSWVWGELLFDKFKT